MSGYKGKNPFGDDDDDVGTFGGSSKPAPKFGTGGVGGGYRTGGSGSAYGGSGGSGYGQRSGMNDYSSGMDQDNSVQSQMQSSKQRTSESQQRALQSIYRSEQIGVETARELVDQGEKLQKVERQVDEIEQMQKASQQHINSLSSVFGGIKNFFSKKPEPIKKVEDLPPNPPRNSNLTEAISKSSSYQPPSHTTNQQQGVYSATSNKPPNEFDQNLDLMSDGMSRLKGLAVGLNSEIDTQNQQLDRLAPKMTRTADTTRRQNREMNTILYGKPK